MRITKAEFVKSCADLGGYASAAQSGAPEFCVVGRSNVGKSTFINMLTGRKDLARTSSAPGRTRLINLFDINGGAFRLVDLPGYGYALAAKKEKAGWDALMGGYLGGSRNLVRAFVLIDSRRVPSELDLNMIKYFYVYGIPFTAVATKCDKLSRAELDRNIGAIASAIGVGKDDVIAVDCKGMGKDRILSAIESALSALTS